MRCRTFFHCLAGLAAAALLANCGGAPPPSESFYRLTPAIQVAPRAGGPLPGAVEVPSFRADGLLGDRSILYRKGSSNVAGYSYHLWWTVPTVLVQQSLIDTLRRATAFETVAGPEMKLNRAFEIIGRIRRFEQNGASVIVELELNLRPSRAGGGTLLLKTYTQEIAAADASVPAAVAAFSTAFDHIWAEFITDLATIKFF